MSKKGFLTPELENWLVQNYRNKSDKELALEATKMVLSRIYEREARIKSTLNCVTHSGTRRALERELVKYDNFKGVSVTMIRAWAKKLNCNGKTLAHVASMNRLKAKVSNNKLWLSKAQKVEQFKTFIESMVLREVRFVVADSRKQADCYRAAISMYNSGMGRVNGISLTSSYNKEINVMRIEAKINYSIQD